MEEDDDEEEEEEEEEDEVRSLFKGLRFNRVFILVVFVVVVALESCNNAFDHSSIV